MRFILAQICGFIHISILFEIGSTLQCYSCNSKLDEHCEDPFSKDQQNLPSKIVNCSSEISAHKFILYFSNLLNLLGVTTDLKGKYAYQNHDSSKPSACQKVVIMENNTRVTIRECALLSNFICDTLNKNEVGAENQWVEYCEICDQNFCNGSSVATIHLGFMILIIFLLLP